MRIQEELANSTQTEPRLQGGSSNHCANPMEQQQSNIHIENERKLVFRFLYIQLAGNPN